MPTPNQERRDNREYASRDSLITLFDRFEEFRKEMQERFDRFESRLDDLKVEIHDIKIDVALIKQHQEQDRASNAVEHGQIVERLDTLEKSDAKQNELIQKATGASAVVGRVSAILWGIIIAAASGAGVWLFMR